MRKLIRLLIFTMMLVTIIQGIALADISPGCSANPLSTEFADVNGDGKADAIAINNQNIIVKVSNGTRFLSDSIWLTVNNGFEQYAFVDINNDNKADAIRVTPQSISVYTSDGNQFIGGQFTSLNSGFGGDRCSFPCQYSALGPAFYTHFADVNDDGNFDAIAVDSQKGVKVRLSDGTQFLPETTWINTPFYGDWGTYFADVTGDGKADAIAANTGSGITVFASDGTNFVNPAIYAFFPYILQFISYQYDYGSQLKFADVNADGAADAIMLYGLGIDVLTELNPSQQPVIMTTPPPLIPLTYKYWTSFDASITGNIGNYYADVTGDQKVDAIAVNTDKTIVVLASDGSQFIDETYWTLGSFFGDAAPSCIN